MDIYQIGAILAIVLIASFIVPNEKIKGILVGIWVIMLLIVSIGFIFFQICPSCGQVNSKFVTTCGYCGEYLPDESFHGDTLQKRIDKLDKGEKLNG